jgi:hypothetical protein
LNFLIKTQQNLFFNFILLTVYFNNFLGLLPIFIFFVLTWVFFILNNFFYYSVKPLQIDKINKTHFYKKLDYTIFLKWNIICTLFLVVVMFLFKSESLTFFWNHLNLNNFKMWVIFFLIIVNLFVFIFLKIVTRSNVPHSIDFFFVIANLGAFLPILFCVNSLYTFLFLIEVISSLLFYKFTVSKIWFKSNNELTKTKNKFLKTLPQQYMTMLFFQFWSTFFSTILIFVSLLNIFSIFGTTEWVYMDILFKLGVGSGYIDNHYYFIALLIPLLIGIFLKLGVTPLHLYKIEVYKGLPFVTVFFYTTYFFLSFIIFFCYLLMYLLNFFDMYWISLFPPLFTIGAVFVVALLFDVQYVKAFFAYSTVINVLLIFLILILYFNH